MNSLPKTERQEDLFEAIQDVSHTMLKHPQEIGPELEEYLAALCREIFEFLMRRSMGGNHIGRGMQSLANTVSPSAFGQFLLARMSLGERPDVEERKFWLEVAHVLGQERAQHLYHSAVFVTRVVPPDEER